MEYSYYNTGEQRRTYQEMRQKPIPRDTFFSLKNESQLHRQSVATEFMDTDWDEEEEEILSDVEDDNSPRLSVQSSGQPSFTTVSSYDEVPTPRSSRSQEEGYYQYSPKQVEGPRGPHLFRSSTASSFDEDVVLTLSPITSKPARGIADLLVQPQAPRRNSPFQYTYEDLDTSNLADWTPEMVAQSMLNAGIELSMADRFMENDINGAILITLKFEDLRELDIQSFGIRTKVWHQIQALRDSRPTSPRPETPIEDAPSREAKRETRKKQDDQGLTRRKSSKRRQRKNKHNDDITPMESVSIIGIEQVIPKPHSCSKGENCTKWKKQQALMRAFRKEHPNIDLSTFGTVMIGDAGNPDTARAIDPIETLRPVSDAVPSVVASSDVLGPGTLPAFQYLQEATLRSFQSRDPQDNVRQFLNFQHQELRDDCNDVPPTPPFQANPGVQVPHHNLRRLPRLSIPNKPPPPRVVQPPRAATVPPPQQAYEQAQQQPPVQHNDFHPYSMDKADPMSPDLETPRNPYRFGTPFSEVDVPVTAVPIGPVARDNSQSVPPDMNYRTSPIRGNPAPPRCQSRASARRPSFPVLPALTENKPTLVHRPAPKAPSPKSPRASVRSQQSQQPLQAPPRVNYPWSPVERTNFEKAIPPMPSAAELAPAPTADLANGVTHQGPMKKRKTRMLRHEWNDGYFTLKGTRLNMHKDVSELDRTLEYVDIDDYAIACSSAASSSKLSAAFKAVHLTHNREKSDPGAFSFQLVPQDKNTARLRKRESAAINAASANSAEGVNGTGKTHHFAVKGRDDRIDWMRELMLAKALRQKGEGFEISVNGNMI
ncbi:hypothetical protein G7Z17_g9303 [Cylindrodendrum hubeiense]|uniref:Protein pob1 n=1 Tax=Cylindrodendrum hubeiense TaxID=595255 RepID=A0A9P5L5T6_9HYPO|nr:hypothetical protein G7Z17_g9303 [Cylindrodendrum hubeiense]